MLRVWLASAAASEATNISSSPSPRITGLPLRATTIDFGLLGVEHGEAIGARHEAQRRAHSVLERSAGIAAMRCASTSESVCDKNTTP